MSEGKYTPGPWVKGGGRVSWSAEPEEGSGEQWQPVGPASGLHPVCLVVGIYSGPSSDAEFGANARLIAAAPDLLAVVRSVEWAAETDMEDGGTEPSCPSCGEAERTGHAPACRLAAAIARATQDPDTTAHVAEREVDRDLGH